MKRLIILFVALAITTISVEAQKGKSLAALKKGDKVLKWKNGYDKFVDVEFKDFLDKSFSMDTIKDVTMKVLVKAKFKLKNRLTFVPVKVILLTQEETGEHNAIVDFLGKNAYGVEGKSTSYFKFNKKGEVEHIITQ